MGATSVRSGCRCSSCPPAAAPPPGAHQVDRRTLEGQQLVDELTAFGEYVSPAIGDRTVFVRAFSLGFAISTWAGAAAHGEICSLTDLVERFVSSAPADVP
jgi:hypothetical protein